MTEFNFEKFIKDAKSLKLSAAEKAEGRRLLLVRIAPLSRHYKQGSIFNLLIPRRLTAMPIMILIVLLLAGGVSAAAQHSLPGDALYRVKIGVNERVREALTFSHEGKAGVELNLAIKRLEEIEDVCSKVEVSPAALAKIEANFQTHADAVKARIAELEAKGETAAAADLAANFQTSLSAHERILAMLKSEEGCVAEVKVFAPKVHSENEAAVETSSKLESQITSHASADVQAAAEGKITAAANKIAEVQSYIDSKKDEFSAESVARAEASLKEATDLKAKAESDLAAGHSGQAFVEAQEALQTAQQAKLLLNAEIRLKIEFRSESSVETNEIKTNSQEQSESAGAGARGESESRGDIHIRLGE